MPNLICTGCSSGLGLNALLHLTRGAGAEWRIFLGARSAATAVPPALSHHLPAGAVTAHQLDLLDHASVSAFAEDVKSALARESKKATHVLLCAGMNDSAYRPVAPAAFSREAVVNHFSQCDLLEALDEVLEPDARIVIVSSSLHTSAPPLDDLLSILTGEKESKDRMARYKASKLLQLAYASSYARSHPNRQVVAVSPGFVPDTCLSRESNLLTRLLMRYVLSWMPFATSIDVGSRAIARGLTITFSENDMKEGEMVYIDKEGQKIEYDKRADSEQARKLALLEYQRQ